ncbi:MAG: signal peptide peptidase SppA [Candidatus Micrarchaeota archaeon]|nr:signal peptide peptidase SppA [Candidatus Micrarchaeota archaeon]
MKRPQGISIIGMLALIIILFAVAMVLLAAIGQVLGVVFLSKPCIAEVRIESEITDRKPPTSIFAPEPPPSTKEILEMISSAEERSDVKAIVLYVDSPGGEVIPSREIYERVKSSRKPVVAYFRSMAASGGYYAAVGSDYIVSEPETITGSIGVRTTAVSLAGLFDKVGINYTSVTSGELKDMGDIGHNLTAKERAVLQSIVDEIFGEFKDTVYENRHGRPRFSDDRFEEVLDGRILTGKQAYQIGLVDELGNETRAFNKAAELAGVSEYDKCEISPQRGILRSFMEELAKPVHVNVNINTNIAQAQGTRVSYT